jgi:uncharacterized glyoxalase superfamily protein PhnB
MKIASPNFAGGKMAGYSQLNADLFVLENHGHVEQCHARQAGADIAMEPEDQDYGGRLYVCRDLEGHVWSFGSYDPWAE